MKVQIKHKMIAVTSVALISGLFMAPLNGNARGFGRGQGNGMGNRQSQQPGLANTISTMPMQDLDTEEKAGLLKMREEEKLARDVYQVLYQKWNHLTFAQIGKSEQKHMDTLKILLDKYGLVDPISIADTGIFTDPELQKLYHSLVVKGEQSVRDALQVGATIEDLDIKDLYDLIEQTDNKDIKIVYQNLVKGSRNHLRSFSYRLSLHNSSYQAQFLTATQVDDIVNSPRERGMVDENGAKANGKPVSGKGKGRKG